MRLPAIFACSVVVCCLILPARPASAVAAGARLDSTERKVIRLVNQIRARHGLRRLKVSPALAKAAGVHSGDMVSRDFFSHASSDGTSMTTRVRRYTGARWVGENLAIVTRRHRVSARRVVLMWMNSPGHRKVLLARSSRRIGVGKCTGHYGAVPAAVFTADFASRF
jgi:uncharacterized protein YkwD